MRYLFVGERRSEKAMRLGYYWVDGKLAAKTLFSALENINIDPFEHEFTNWFEWNNSPDRVRWFQSRGFVIVGMGNKVQNELDKNGISHIKIIHPAARGKIRLKENYFKHIKTKLAYE